MARRLSDQRAANSRAALGLCLGRERASGNSAGGERAGRTSPLRGPVFSAANGPSSCPSPMQVRRTEEYLFARSRLLVSILTRTMHTELGEQSKAECVLHSGHLGVMLRLWVRLVLYLAPLVDSSKYYFFSEKVIPSSNYQRCRN